MMSQPVTKIVFYSAALIVFGAIVFTGPTDSRRSTADNETAALAAIFGPPQRGGGSGEGPKSVFDSSFWSSGVGQKPILDPAGPSQPQGEPEILEKASEGNPTNPQTGLPYTDEQMGQFETLRQKFPGNSIIPQRVTPERQQQLEEDRRQMVEIQQRITARKASADDVTVFYDHQMKGIKDRAELLQYVLEKMGDEMDDDMKAKYSSVLETNRKQIQNLEDQKQKAIRNAVN